MANGRRCLIAAAVACVVLAPEARQSPAPPQTTFRAGVDLVDVDVSVLDRHRLPVRDLTAADFTVFEDGKPRPIVAFTAVDLPSRELPPAQWMDDVAPDVATNAFPREGRLIVILMDRAITIVQRPVAQDIAAAAVGLLRPGDLAAVVYSTLGIPQNFTSDRQRLLEAIRRPFSTLPEGDSGSPAECYCGACSLETIARLAEAVQDVRQRRKILFVIGTNISVQSTGGCSGVLAAARRRALRAAEVGNITVHSFDPSGLQTLAPTASQSASSGNRPAMANLMRQGNLRLLPDHTGGRAVTANLPAESVSEILRESHSYYVLGFQPAKANADGRFHEIAVKVARPGVTLQARQGYYAPGRVRPAPRTSAGAVPDTLADAVRNVWPQTHFPLNMSAVPFATPGLQGATVAVLLGVGPQVDRTAAGLSMPAFAAPPHTTATVLVGAFDRNGRSWGSHHQTISVTPRPASAGAYEYEVEARLPLKPGRYEIRASVEDSALGGTSSVYGYVDVPNFAAEHVTLSGILLDRTPAGAPASIAAEGDLLPIVPTVRRVFAPTDRVAAFLRINQGLRRALMPGYLVAQIRNELDSRVFQQELRIVPDQFGANRAMDFTLDVPVSRLSVGEYLLTIQATHGNATARRDVRFRVE